MTKLTFDVDFNKDPEEILREIQERAKEEVAKRESKEKSKIYLSNLHKRVNEDLGTNYTSINELIKALTACANPKGRTKIAQTSPSGRRVTISMDKQIFDEIKDLLSQPNPNKAAIARQTGVSVVQVRKVAKGGYDSKFGKGTTAPTSPSQTNTEPSPEVSAPELKTEEPLLDLPTVSAPPAPLAEDKTNISDSIDPQPEPSLDLPPAPEAPPAAPESPLTEPVAEEPLLPTPSLAEEEADIPAPIAPPPAPSLDLPPVPEAPPAAPEPPLPEPVAEVPSPELTPSPPAPSLDDVPPSPPAPTPPAPAVAPGAPPKPSLSLKKPAGTGAKPGGTKFSLKTGKKKTTGLKITRPPMKPPSA